MLQIFFLGRLKLFGFIYNQTLCPYQYLQLFLLRSGFHRAMYNACKFFLVLVFFGAFEITVHVQNRC